MGDRLVIEKVVHIVAEHLNEERLSLFCLIESDFFNEKFFNECLPLTNER